MGLDMYLFIRESEYASKHYSVGGKLKVKYPKEILDIFENFKDENYKDENVWDDRSVSRTTDYKVGYWRKANHIHRWFVKNCADGVDECQDIYVSLPELIELDKACREVLNDHSKASELLPTQDGFFFGGTEYDEYYFKDIEDTMEIIEKAIHFLEVQGKKKNSKKRFEVIYRASW